MEGVRVGAGVDLADLRADHSGCLDLSDVGVDEDRRDDARRRESCHDLLQPLRLPRHVEPAFGRDFLAAFRYEHRHLGFHFHGDVDHFIGRRHFEIELDVNEIAQTTHVLVLDVAPILAQMHGDAVGAAEMRFDGRPHGIRLMRAPRLPQRRHVVDIDAELDHRFAPLLI